MNKQFSEQILADKLAKLNSTQQCIETLSHWCIFHRSKAQEVVTTWDSQFRISEMEKKVPLLYLANDILQNSRRKGDEFVTEFWKVLPAALKEVVEKGNEHGKNAVSRLVGIWEERKVFGSRSQNLKELMFGEELPPPLELGKKRSRSVKIVKRDSRSIKTKLSVGGTAEKIVSAFHLVQSEHASEDEGMTNCKSVVQRVKSMEKDVDVALTKAKDPSRKTLAKGLEDEEKLLKDCIEKLKVFEANRVTLVSQLKDALHVQESELENLRTQMQVAQAQAEEAANMRMRLDSEHVFELKPSITSTNSNAKPVEAKKKSAAAIAAEVVDKLTASTSSQYIMTSVLSSFAAEEAKNAGLMSSFTPSNSFSTPFNGPMPTSENLMPVSDPNLIMPNPPQNNPYQSLMVPGQIQSPQAYYHSVPNQASMQYMQLSSGMMSSYDYSGGVPPLPPAPAPPSYMVNSMVPLSQQPMQMGQQQQLNLGHQQQPVSVSQQPPAPPSFRPLAPTQAQGMVYYTHSYPSQR